MYIGELANLMMNIGATKLASRFRGYCNANNILPSRKIDLELLLAIPDRYIFGAGKALTKYNCVTKFINMQRDNANI